MRGHITQRGKDPNSWTIVVSMGKDPATGKRLRHWEAFKGGSREAQKRLSELLHQRDTGMIARPGKTTVADYLNRWLHDYAKPNLSPRAYERYEGIVTGHLIPGIGLTKLGQLRSDHLQKLYAADLDAGLMARTVRYHHVVIHRALQLALKWGLVPRNVADGVDIPRARRPEIQTWNEEEVSAFLGAARRTPYYSLFHLALFTGMRRSELLALRWSDFDLLYCQVSVKRSLHHLDDGSYVYSQPKSAKSNRTIALSPSAILALKQHREREELDRAMVNQVLADDDLVFNALGKPLRPETISRAWVNLAKRAGLKPIRLHDARHTHASLMLKQGIHPKIVQERLGHSSIAITLDTYSHVAPGLQEAAAKRFDDAIASRYNDKAAQEIGLQNGSKSV
ncbi:MAG: site-specific integrase [Chloroflexi bacterium]|nr:site-specific integrase [Chloroflexota bacterium]